MKPVHTLATSLCAAGALLLPSCINMEQDIWINKDGSGRVVLDLGISKQAEQMMSSFAEGLGGEGGENPFDMDPAAEAEKIKKNEYVTDAKVEKTTDEKYTHFIYTLDLTDITKLAEVQENVLSDGPMAGGPAGESSPDTEFIIEKTDSGTFKMVASIKGEEPDEEMDAFAAGMMKQMFGDAAFTIRVHAPAVSHNGTEEDGAVVWTLPLADMATGKTLDIEAEFKPGGSPGGSGIAMWLVLGSVLLLAGILFFVFQAQKPNLA